MHVKGLIFPRFSGSHGFAFILGRLLRESIYINPPENAGKTGNTFIPEDSSRCRVPCLCRKLAACQENLQQFQQQFEDGFGAGGVIFSPAGTLAAVKSRASLNKKDRNGRLDIQFCPIFKQNTVTCFVLGCGHVKPRPRQHVTTRISQQLSKWCVNEVITYLYMGIY